MMKLQANILKTISQQSEGKEDHGAEKRGGWQQKEEECVADVILSAFKWVKIRHFCI